MDEILHHFATMASHCWLVFTGDHHSRVSERWCEMDFASIHSITTGIIWIFPRGLQQMEALRADGKPPTGGPLPAACS